MTIQESNKRYRLLKDLPTFKAGDEFFISESGNLIAGTPEKPKKVLVVDEKFISPIEASLLAYTKEMLQQSPNILTDWFEEIIEKKWHDYYYLDEFGHIHKQRYTTDDDFDHRIHDWKKSIGNCFATRREAKQYRKWLKARAVLIQDAKGFKPDWNNWDELKWCVEYNYINNCLHAIYTTNHNFSAIHFESREDVSESIKTHEKEWKIYLGVE